MADLILIVDDDESVRTTLYKVVRSNGLEAEMASSGEQALELTGKTHYDLILLDVNMHGMDGFTVVQKLRGRGIKSPIIIFIMKGLKVNHFYFYPNIQVPYFVTIL